MDLISEAPRTLIGVLPYSDRWPLFSQRRLIRSASGPAPQGLLKPSPALIPQPKPIPSPCPCALIITQIRQIGQKGRNLNHLHYAREFNIDPSAGPVRQRRRN